MVISEFYEYFVYEKQNEIRHHKKEFDKSLHLSIAFINLKSEIEKARQKDKNNSKKGFSEGNTSTEKNQVKIKLRTPMLRKIAESLYKKQMRKFFQICAMVNFIIILIEVDNQELNLEELNILDIVLTFIFFIEFCLFNCVIGVKTYFNLSFYTKLEFLICFYAIFLYIYEISNNTLLNAYGGGLKAFLYGLKVIRIMKYMSQSRINFFRSIQKLFVEIVKSIVCVWDTILIIIICFLVSSFIGIELFKSDHEQHIIRDGASMYIYI